MAIPFTHIDLVKSVFLTAADDRGLLDTLISNPSDVFLKFGMSIPEDNRAEFNTYFREQAEPVLAVINENEPGEQAVEAVKKSKSFTCTSCKIAAFVIALTLVAAAAAGTLAGLTVASPVVLALAAFAGVSAAVALAFIKTFIIGVVSKGVWGVADEICKWIKACP